MTSTGTLVLVSSVGERPLVMGILNVTPDSFSDGGLFFALDDAVAHGFRLIAEGADIVDVGGESTRPGAEGVDSETEVSRVVPVVEALSPHVRVSVDTSKPVVARAAVEAGATLINDVSASLYPVAAETGAGWVAMHMQGTPRTMQEKPQYDDVVAEVSAFLAERAEVAESAGVGEVWIDPGIGFGKTAAHNLSILRRLPDLAAMGWPVALGTSRKGFLGELLGTSDSPGTSGGAPAGDRLEGSLASAVWALTCGVRMIRVHDVEATVQAVRVVSGKIGARLEAA